MKITEAVEFLTWLQENKVTDEIRIVVPIVGEMKINNILPSIKKQGYSAALQASAFHDREINVVDKVENYEFI